MSLRARATALLRASEIFCTGSTSYSTGTGSRVRNDSTIALADSVESLSTTIMEYEKFPCVICLPNSVSKFANSRGRLKVQTQTEISGSSGFISVGLGRDEWLTRPFRAADLDFEGRTGSFAAMS